MLRKAERKRRDSFELWCWRRLLRIPWTARRTNESVLDEVKYAIQVDALIKKQQLQVSGPHPARPQNIIEAWSGPAHGLRAGPARAGP